MQMGMVPIIVGVRMLVLQRFVSMLVRVPLHEVQQHTGEHQQRSRDQPD